MPKTSNTRAQRADELLARIKRGPAFIDMGDVTTPDEAKRRYQAWAETWCIHELIDLIPELRKCRKS